MSGFGIHHHVVKAALAAPYLARGEEHDLAQRWRDEGDEEALHILASSHIRLVMAIASRFRHYGLPLADLAQEGHIGLLEAAARFEPAREVQFSTYASWWIRASIQDFVLRNWSIVRGGTSSAQKSLFFKLRRLRLQVARSSSDLTVADIQERIAGALGVSTRDVETMEARLSGHDVSLNASAASNDADRAADRQSFLVDDKPLPDEVAAQRLDTSRRSHWLHDALAMLSDRERLVIEQRRLLDDGMVTLEAVGRHLGISKERVRQIENRALSKLKKALLSQGNGEFVELA